MKLKVGDTVMVYTGKGSGSNYQGTIDIVDESDNTVHILVKRYNSNQPHRASGWYTPRKSKRGNWYVVETR